MNIKHLLLVARDRLRQERQAGRNRQAVHSNTQPGSIFFQPEIHKLLGCTESWLVETAAEYRACPAAWKNLSGFRSSSRKTDGISKSLDVAEGFALWALVKHIRPSVVVELGIQYGISSRLWKEALTMYVPDHKLVLCDLEDKRRFIGDEECSFLQGDARQILPHLFASEQVHILHNDAHPYDLIHWSVTEALKHKVPVLTFHDVGKGTRGPFKVESSQLSKEQKLANSENWAQYGTWERHVMADIFGKRVLCEDEVEGDSFRVHIFDTLFGFGVVMQNRSD